MPLDWRAVRRVVANVPVAAELVAGHFAGHFDFVDVVAGGVELQLVVAHSEHELAWTLVVGFATVHFDEFAAELVVGGEVG